MSTTPNWVFPLPQAIAKLTALSLTLGIPSAVAARPLSFADRCEQPQLSDAERHTVAVLLEVAGTQDCAAASASLSSLSALDLTDQQLVELGPLESLTQLQTLTLNQNQISDITPLANLTGLSELYLFENQVEDLGAIAPLTGLTTLYLDRNQIRDLSPLSSLTNLEILYANGNQIEAVDPLAQLPLTQLYLSGNQISDVELLRSLTTLTNLDISRNGVDTASPLAPLTRLTQLDISRNDIAQIGVLSSLTQLAKLGLEDNPIAPKTCPVAPATVCIFTDDAADLYLQGQQQIGAGELDAALATFQTALDLYRNSGNRLRESDALDRIGNIYAERGEYANALDYYQQSAAVRQAIGDPQGEVDTLAYLGTTYIRLGQIERAISLLQQAREQYQALVADIAAQSSNRAGQVQEGLILNGLALAYSRSGDGMQALRFAKLSLADYRINGDLRGEAIALNQVGQAYLQLGDLDKARRYLTQALDFTQAKDDPAGMARSRYGLGQLAAQENKPEEALDQYDKALEIWRSLKASEGESTRTRERESYVSGEAETLNAKGELLLQQGDPEAAALALRQAVSAWEQQRPGLTDADKISIIETQTHTYSLLQRALVAIGDPGKALEISERGRSRAFAELLAHRLSLRGQAPPKQQIQAPALDQIKATARARNATLVEYSLVGREIYIWVVAPTGQVHFHTSPLNESLADLVTQERIRLERLGFELRNTRGIAVEGENGAAGGEVFRSLHQLLIDPIAEVLPEKDATVVVIPHRELFLIPFAALPDENGQVLIEKYPLLFAPAISLLNAPREQAALNIGSDPALVVGDPAMPNHPSRGLPLDPLPGARREAERIAPLLRTEPLTDQQATKTEVVSRMSDAAIVHLATHGLLEDFGTGVPGALALAPTRDSDGYLTTAEISELPLTARLVVLSACDTGLGTITGDGVIGLSRSFLTAGVESVVVSLWAVSDEATVDLMAEFYGQLEEESNRAIALQQAMLKIRALHPDDPAKWAAFTLFGAAGQ
ncbi:MAG: CHAT domain-containing protein [Elainellaceae cyanobacterium]